jgi:pyrimidine operon attenuation protein/uracil phosphoribosyltransferase
MAERAAMDSEWISARIRRMAQQIVERAGKGELALVAIRRGGVHLARRLLAEMKPSGKVPVGEVDIALYRDDVAARGGAPVVGPTDISFPVQGKSIVLVDDVLYTGRTVRAALDEIIDFGRPKRVFLAVLIDRGGRELPIQADFVGGKLEAGPGEDVVVRLAETAAPGDAVLVRGHGASE